jgi:hypothetical protein
MDTFAQRIQEWQMFYATVAGASATLTGLLFVSLSLNVDFLSRKENVDLQRKARQTFGNFIYVIMIALMFLIPRQGPLGLGLPLLFMGGFGIGPRGVVELLVETVREPGDRPRVGYYVHEYGLSLLAYLGLMAVAVTVLFGSVESLYWLVAVVAALLASASRNAWFLLMQIRVYSKNDGQS